MRLRLALLLLLLSLLAPAVAAAEPTDPLYPSIGPAGGFQFLVNPSTPPGIDSARFVAVVQRSLPRWGNTYGGLTQLDPDDTADGVNVIGFSPRVTGDTLGLDSAVTYTQTTRSPGRRTCTTEETPVRKRILVRKTVRVRKRVKVRRRDGRVVLRFRRVTVVRRVPRIVTVLESREVCTTGPDTETTTTRTEHGVTFNRDKPWQMGPDKPAAGELDFETVLLHELGHVSGLGHTAEECTASSPMAAGLAAGDWWRSPADLKMSC